MVVLEREESLDAHMEILEAVKEIPAYDEELVHQLDLIADKKKLELNQLRSYIRDFKIIVKWVYFAEWRLAIVARNSQSC